MCARVLHSLSNVPDTGVVTYKYGKPLYSPLHILHCALWKHEPGQAGTQVDRGEALNTVSHVRHSQLGEFSESWGA